VSLMSPAGAIAQKARAWDMGAGGRSRADREGRGMSQGPLAESAGFARARTLGSRYRAFRERPHEDGQASREQRVAPFGA
jgi:hypothetical protein